MKLALETISFSVLAAPLFGQIQNPPDDGQWVMAPKNYASSRFSTLDQINTSNVKNLKLCLELFDWRDAWPRSGSAGCKQYDVHCHAMAKLLVRARPHETGCANEMGLSAESLAGIARRGLLRCCEPRC